MYLIDNMSTFNGVGVKCPRKDCQSIADEDFLHLALDRKELASYKDRAKRNDMMEKGLIVKCMKCFEDVILPLKKVLTVKCSSCNWTLCSNCRNPYHPNKSCRQAGEERIKEEQMHALEIELEDMEDHHLYKCPNGHPYIIGGCGNPVEVGACFCGRNIGGRNHNLAAGNLRAKIRDVLAKRILD
jgi:ribosomal protein S27E